MIVRSRSLARRPMGRECSGAYGGFARLRAMALKSRSRRSDLVAMVLSLEIVVAVLVAGGAAGFATLSALAEAIDGHARITGLRREVRRLRATRARPE